MLNKEKKLEAFERALDVMDKLRSDCPWNHAQTIDTLRPMTIEEVYELSDAVLKKDETALEKELGDVFLHIIFYAKIAEEEGRYDIADVMNKLCEKMIYRHPHVFSTTKVADAEEVSTNWEMLKAKEKGGNKRILSGIPDSLPPILKAYSMQDKARGVGFDWEEKSQVWDKVKEEQGELQAEFEAMDAAVSEDDKKPLMSVRRKNSVISCSPRSMPPGSTGLILTRPSTRPVTSSGDVSPTWRSTRSVRDVTSMT